MRCCFARSFAPRAARPSSPPLSVTGGLLSVIFHRFTDGIVRYALQRSRDLLGWTPFTPAKLTVQTDPTIEVRKATDPLPIGGDTQRFLRRQITTPSSDARTFV